MCLDYIAIVKGLWEKRPEDWDERVPFVDPNNRLKNEGEKKNVKPKKELLGQMLTYLVDRYTVGHFYMVTCDEMHYNTNYLFSIISSEPLLGFF